MRSSLKTAVPSGAKGRPFFIFHTNFTETTPGFHLILLFLWKQTKSLHADAGKAFTIEKEEWRMFLGMQWYWWLLIVAVLIISIPFKIKFMKWWKKRQQEKENSGRGKWGDDE